MLAPWQCLGWSSRGGGSCPWTSRQGEERGCDEKVASRAQAEAETSQGTLQEDLLDMNFAGWGAGAGGAPGPPLLRVPGSAVSNALGARAS